MIWKPLKHPMILDGYLISNEGHIRNKDCDESDCLTADYHASNGYDFILLIVKEKYRINNSLFMLFPIDELLGIAFIPIPKELMDKPITIKHINGDTRDNHISNLEWIEDIEEWRDCTYPGVKPDMYEVSSWGRIRNKKTNTIRVLCDNSRGYLGLKIDNKQFKIHRLVAWEFLLNKKELLKTVNHINGNKMKNHIKNLEIVTRGDNLKHAYMLELKTHMKCENHPISKLLNSDVEYICQLLIKYKGWSIDVYNELISCGYNVSKAIIDQILYKKTWTSISDQYFDKNTFIKMRYDEVRLIRETLNKHNGSAAKTFRELKGHIPHLTYQKIQNIHLGRTWIGVY